MEYKNVEKKDFKGNKVKVLAETYDPGIPEIKGCGEDLGWRKNLLITYMRCLEERKNIKHGRKKVITGNFFCSPWRPYIFAQI